MPPRRILARGRGRGHVLVVAGVTISQSGEIWGGGDGGDTARRADRRREAGAGQPSGSAEGAGAQRRRPRLTALARARSEGTCATAGSRAAWSAAFSRIFGAIARNFRRSAADVPPSQRKVARRVDLALSTSPERFRTAADGVLDVVRDHRGYVLRSSVSGGDPDAPRSRLGHASFKLRIPARELPAALGDLSDLGHVVSRTDGRVDITSRFVSAQKRIAALEETRQNLLRKLAEAVTPTEQESIRRRLEIVEAQLSAAEEELGAAQRRVELVPLSVTIDADRALAGATTPAGGASATPWTTPGRCSP